MNEIVGLSIILNQSGPLSIKVPIITYNNLKFVQTHPDDGQRNIH